MLVFALVAVLLITACSPTAIPPPKPIPKEYTSLVVDKGLIRYSFEYPKYYEPTPPIFEPGATSSMRVYLHYPESAAPKILSYLGVYASYPWETEGELGPKLVVEKELALWSAFRGFQFVGRSSRTVSGFAAEEIAYYNYPLPPFELTYDKTYFNKTYFSRLHLYRTAFFSRGNQTYWISWFAPAEIASSFWDDFDHVLDTFRFLD